MTRRRRRILVELQGQNEQTTASSALSELEDQDWREYRKDLVTGRQDSIKSFDQAMLTLSSAALGIALTIVNQIVTNAGTEITDTQRWWLGATWTCFGVSIVATTFSFLCSQVAFDKDIAIADRVLQGNEEAKQETHPFGRLTAKLNWISAGGFLSGVFALGCLLYLTL